MSNIFKKTQSHRHIDKKSSRKGSPKNKGGNYPGSKVRSRSPLPPPPGSSSLNRPGDGSGYGYGYQKQKRTITPERLLAGGIFAALSAIALCLFIYFCPLSGKELLTAVKSFPDYISEAFTKLKKNEPDLNQTLAIETESETETEESEVPLLETKEAVPYIDRSAELGNIADMTSEPVYPVQDDAIYSCMLDTSLGPLLYYNQGDIRWKEYLYGGSDRLSKYGCGPVCTAMLINSFTPNSVSPIEIADWSAANGYYASQSGSYHGLIPGSLTAFGLQVDSVTERTPENVTELLRSGHVLVALMGHGTLTQNGHFIIIAQSCANGNVYIADPASYENSTKEWDLQLLMDELKKSYDSGGPLWAVSFGA